MPRPAKVVMMLDSLLAGGAERIAVEVACALDPSRFEASVLVLRHTGALEDKLRNAGLRYDILGRTGKSMPPAIFRKARGVVAGADLLHAHKFEGSMWGALLARTTGVRLVTRDPMWTGDASRVRTFGYRYWIGRRASAIVTPSSIVADSIVAEGVERAKLHVIPNGVPVDAALERADARSELGLAGDAFVVGIIARLREQKRHDVLLRAAARLAREGRKATLCIVGSGEEEPALRDLARSLGLDGTICWAGERKDARRLARAFDIAVFTSWWEGLPVAGLEILAAGVPLVTTPVGALPEVLEGGVGVFVDVGDDEGLAAVLERLMDDPDERARLGALGRDRIVERYSFDRMVTRFSDLYETVLTSPRRPGS